jgi:hypothetical protein
MMCSNQGKLRCSGCRGAEPETIYCGEGCQKRVSFFGSLEIGSIAKFFMFMLVWVGLEIS